MTGGEFEYLPTNIDAPMMIDQIISACPSFLPDWLEFVGYWKLDTSVETQKNLPYYLALSDFSRHLVKKLEDGDIEHFSLVFLTVEKCLIQGSPYVKEAIAIGLLEDLQNQNFYRKCSPADFLRWLEHAVFTQKHSLSF